MNIRLPPKRDMPGKRWLSICLRCLHLVGIAGLAGAYLYNSPEAEWYPYLLLTLISGCLMLLKEVYCDAIWLLQLRGQAIFCKLLLLLAGIWLLPEPDSMLYIIVIVLSGIVAHAPGKVRYYSFWHRSVLTRELLCQETTEIKNCGEL